jgi:hypothetical protein
VIKDPLMPSSGARRAPLEDAMANQRRRPSRDLQRRIRARQRKTGKPYMAAALDITTEQTRAQRYLSDPAVPADLASAVRDGGFIPLEPLARGKGWHWWCRCSRCGEVIVVYPDGHGYQAPGRPRYYLHSCAARRTVRREGCQDEPLDWTVITSMLDWQ